VQPYFIVDGDKIQREARAGMGLWQVSADVAAEETRALTRAGAGGVMLFGVPSAKWVDGQPLEPLLTNVVQAAERIRQSTPDALIYADVCLCSYTEHGHCGVLRGQEVDNDRTLPVLGQMALALARAGVDFVCPSDMMDGRVGYLRHTLDEAGFSHVGIVSYAVKMSSALYGPFRDAAHSAPSFGDRTTYQMPAANRREALRELELDAAEGADALLIKPAMSNLDLIRDARERFDHPLFAYQVSGEYAMFKAAADAGLLDFKRAMDEILVSLRRAGADVIISYDTRRRAGLA
jgi:porphobilinogen synthase